MWVDKRINTDERTISLEKWLVSKAIPLAMSRLVQPLISIWHFRHKLVVKMMSTAKTNYNIITTLQKKQKTVFASFLFLFRGKCILS